MLEFSGIRTQSVLFSNPLPFVPKTY